MIPFHQSPGVVIRRLYFAERSMAPGRRAKRPSPVVINPSPAPAELVSFSRACLALMQGGVPEEEAMVLIASGRK